MRFFFLFLLGSAYGIPVIQPLFSATTQRILTLTNILLPSLLFLSLYTVATGFLHCEKHFFRSGFSPVLLNLVWMGTVIAIRDISPEEAVSLLAIGIVLGYAAQWLFVTSPVLSFMWSHLSWKEWTCPNIFSAENRAILHALSLSLLGVGATQLNTALDSLFALASSLEGPAYLSYAIRPQQLPLALFSIAIASAALPTLSRAVQSQDREQFSLLLTHALRQMITLIVPCSLGMLVLGASGINLLYGRGHFSLLATVETTKCLWGYALGLLPMSAIVLLTPSFFAQKNFWTPTCGSLLSVGINIGLNIVFVLGFGWGSATLAVATSLAAWVNALYLWQALPLSLWHPILPTLGEALKRSVLACLLVLGVQLLLHQPPLFWSLFQGHEGNFPRYWLTQICEMFGLSLVFCLPLLRLRYLQDPIKKA